jgi:hypothetical protein
LITPSIVKELRADLVRVDSDFSARPFKAKIADAEQQRVHTDARYRRGQHGNRPGERPPPPRRPARREAKGKHAADFVASIKDRG